MLKIQRGGIICTSNHFSGDQKVWGAAFLAGCSKYLAAVLIALFVLGGMVWLYSYGGPWYGAIALIGSMLAFGVYTIVEDAAEWMRRR